MLPLAKVSACHHRVATSLFFFCGETFDHQREKAGEDGRGGECARTSFPPPVWASGCQGDKTLLTTLPGTKGFSLSSSLLDHLLFP